MRKKYVHLPVPSPPVAESSKERCGGGQGLNDPLGVPVVCVRLDPGRVSDPGTLGDDGGLHRGVIRLVLGLGGGDGDQEEAEQQLEHGDVCVLSVEV